MTSAKRYDDEFKFRTSRSSGKGGQHVNKTETKVELIFNVQDSQVLNEDEKIQVLTKLKTRINENGELRISCDRSRSQPANKKETILRFYQLLEKALKKEKKRVPTKIPKMIKERILDSKRKHSSKKGDRRLKTRDFI